MAPLVAATIGGLHGLNTRFREHRFRCFYGTEMSDGDGGLRESSSLRLYG
jgi:hypothetical protein